VFRNQTTHGTKTEISKGKNKQRQVYADIIVIHTKSLTSQTANRVDRLLKLKQSNKRTNVRVSVERNLQKIFYWNTLSGHLIGNIIISGRAWLKDLDAGQVGAANIL
jgi:hypothetical protein